VKVLYIHFGNISKTEEAAECKLMAKACIASKFRKTFLECYTNVKYLLTDI